MAVSSRNPNGAVSLADGGTPRIISVKARANISGGYWVAGSSAAGAVGSGVDSYATSDFEGFPITTVLGSRCIGIALKDIASGTYGPVAQRGIFLVPCSSGTSLGSVHGGMRVGAGTAGAVVEIGSSAIQDFEAGIDYGIGRALSHGGGHNEQFVAVSLNL